MWKTTKPILASLFGSKKFLALLAGVIVWLVGRGGLELTDADVTPVLLLIGGYIGSVGLTDIGKERAKVAADYLGKPQPPPSPPEG